MRSWKAFLLATCLVLASASDHPMCFSGKLDLVLVVDVSGSDEARFTANRDAALEIAKSMPINWEKASIAIIQYSKSAVMKLEFASSESWEIVNDTIMNLEWIGDVALTAEAMDLAMIQFRRGRPEAARVIVLCSDGNSYNTWEQVGATAERLHYSNSKIYAVALTGSTYDPELKQYVEFSNGTIVRRQSELQELKKDLLSMTVPRCPPPAATPPQDFLRPAESNPDGESAENQLPTRRTRRPRPSGSSDDRQTQADRTRRPDSRSDDSARSSRRSTRRHSTRSGRSTTSAGPGATPGPSVVDAGIDKRV